MLVVPARANPVTSKTSGWGFRPGPFHARISRRISAAWTWGWSRTILCSNWDSGEWSEVAFLGALPGQHLGHHEGPGPAHGHRCNALPGGQEAEPQPVHEHARGGDACAPSHHQPQEFQERPDKRRRGLFQGRQFVVLRAVGKHAVKHRHAGQGQPMKQRGVVPKQEERRVRGEGQEDRRPGHRLLLEDLLQPKPNDVAHGRHHNAPHEQCQGDGACTHGRSDVGKASGQKGSRSQHHGVG